MIFLSLLKTLSICAYCFSDQSQDFSNDVYSLVTVCTTFPDISLSWFVDHRAWNKAALKTS